MPKPVTINERLHYDMAATNGIAVVTMRMTQEVHDQLENDGLERFSILLVKDYRTVPHSIAQRGFLEVEIADIVGHMPGLIALRIVVMAYSRQRDAILLLRAAHRRQRRAQRRLPQPQASTPDITGTSNTALSLNLPIKSSKRHRAGDTVVDTANANVPPSQPHVAEVTNLTALDTVANNGV